MIVVDHSITGRVKHASEDSKIAIFVVFDEDMHCDKVVGAFDSTVASRLIINALTTGTQIPSVIQNMMHIDGKRFGKPKVSFKEYVGSFHKDTVKPMKTAVKRIAKEDV